MAGWTASADAPAPAGELSRSFRELRDAFAKTPTFLGSWSSTPERKAAMQALTDEKHKEFLALSAAWLEKCPVDAKVHLARASVLSAGGDGDVLAAAHHRFMFYGLLESILASGDGRTKASAYHVIAVDEEYTVLNFLGATLKKQSLDGTLDVLEVDLKGALTTIYFDAALSLAATERALQGSDRKPR